MSKSLGNGIDPLEIIEQYGADALRFTLATGNTPGHDMRFHMERVESSRNFANKMWNASRFILMNMEKIDLNVNREELQSHQELSDQWIVSRLNTVSKEVTANLEKFELGIAADKIYEFAWSEFCDWYIELIKPRLYGEDEKAKQTALLTAKYVLEGILKLLHPFMPFITEEIYGKLMQDQKIIVAQWPIYKEEEHNEEAERMMSKLMEMIKAIRNARAEMNVPPSKKAKVMLDAEEQVQKMLEKASDYFKALASASEVEIVERGFSDTESLNVVVDGVNIFIPLAELIDFAKEIERLSKEKAKYEDEIKRAQGKLNNQGFVAKAPQSLIDEEKEKIEKYQELLKTVDERIGLLKK